MRKFLVIFIVGWFLCPFLFAQESFIIKKYDVDIKVNQDASLDVNETINVHFTEPRHGIIRKIPFRYDLQTLPEGTEKADLQLVQYSQLRTIIEDVKVYSHDFWSATNGDYLDIKIGSKDKLVEGDQQYILSYKVLNAINFFTDHSEFYFNVIGNQWDTQIENINFNISLYKPLSDTPTYFIATGPSGSKENNTISKWENNQELKGVTTKDLNNHEGVTAGIRFPDQFLLKPDFANRGKGWLVLPFIVLAGMILIWRRWGKDEAVTVQTEFYPPENVSPSVSGYVIDNRLDKRELTSLIPYWGAGGYLQINETEEPTFLGLIKIKEYEFIKIKNLPPSTMAFEKTMFNGIFKSNDKVKLSSLKNILYVSMEKAKKELLEEIKQDDYYVKYSRGMSCMLPVIGFIAIIAGIIYLAFDNQLHLWQSIGIICSGLIVIIFGALMTKKTQKGTELYQKLLGFKEFIKSVEKDRLQEFLKKDKNYFDIILPYAIVFGIADTWKDKLKGLDVPPPSWYHGSYAGANFNTGMFMGSLNKSMNAMSSSFYSAPSSSGSSGGSFSSGGSSGGGFGGGGGSSW